MQGATSDVKCAAEGERCGPVPSKRMSLRRHRNVAQCA